MSKTETTFGNKVFHIPKTHTRIEIDKKGEIKIGIHQVKTKIFEELVETLKCPVKEYDGTFWVEFSKARDGSKVYVFKE